MPSTPSEVEDLPVTVFGSLRRLAKGPSTNEVRRIREILAKAELDDVDILFGVNEGWPMKEAPPEDWEIDLSWMG